MSNKNVFVIRTDDYDDEVQKVKLPPGTTHVRSESVKNPHTNEEFDLGRAVGPDGEEFQFVTALSMERRTNAAEKKLLDQGIVPNRGGYINSPDDIKRVLENAG